MSIGKITYGRKKKTLGDIDDILPKKPGDEIFDAVAEDLDEDHQKYINQILKLTKTPVKERASREKIDLKKEVRLIEQPLKIDEPKEKMSSSRRQRDISESEIYEKINIPKDERPKFFSGYHPVSQKYEPAKLTAGSELTNRLIRDLEARRSREKTMPNLHIKAKLEPEPQGQIQNRTFLECISEYISQLQTENPGRSTKMDLIVSENKKLRKKVVMYEQRLKETKSAIQQHLEYNSHQKTKERQYKNKIKKLTHALTQAVDKVNEQKDEIEYLQGFLTNFTHQVRAYKHSRTNKEKLTQLLKEEADDYNKFEEVLLRTLNSDDPKMQFTGLGLRDPTKDDLDISDGNENQTSQERLAKIMNTNSYLPISRSKPSRTVSRAEGSKSLSKESKNPFRKNTQTTYINRVCRFQESETD